MLNVSETSALHAGDFFRGISLFLQSTGTIGLNIKHLVKQEL